VSERADDFRRGSRNERLWSEEDGGVKVALQSDARSELSAQGGKVDAPIYREDVRAGPGYGGEQMVGSLGVVDDWRLRVGRVKCGNDLLDCREDEGLVFGEGEFAAPGVEELDGRYTGGDLSLKIGNGGLRDAVEKRMEGSGFGAQKGFYNGERIGAAAFDHVAGEGPRRGGEAEDGNLRAKFADNAANGFR